MVGCQNHGHVHCIELSGEDFSIEGLAIQEAVQNREPYGFVKQVIGLPF